MQIIIKERLRPFSHVPGTFCLLPGTFLRLQLFPALIRLEELSQSQPQLLREIPVPIQGPVKDFTVQLDLERGFVKVWGFSREGYFLYHILPTEYPFEIAIDIKKGLSHWMPLSSKLPSPEQKVLLTDRLSLGNHKSQDWEMVKRRGDLTEILPLWLRVGQQVSLPLDTPLEGTAALLKNCETAAKDQIYDALKNVFFVAFEGILSPRLIDKDYLGFDLAMPSAIASPLIVLSEGAKIIRALFVRMVQRKIYILPHLPPEFHCGRFIGVHCQGLGWIDMEWTKKMLRRMTFRSEATGPLDFFFPHEIKQFRLNGHMHLTGHSLEVLEGKEYIFDRFQK